MMQNNRLLLPLLAALALPTAEIAAQENTPLKGEGEYLMSDAVQLWRHTNSASGLTIDSLEDRGFAEFDFRHHSGSYHRVQEGRQTNTLAFRTESYRHIGRYLYGYGSFVFDNGRTKDRAWSDNMRTYFSNPFITGSAVKARYDFQDFDLSMRVGTIDFSGWRYGIGLDYKVGDMSRLRDPRSRARVLDYRIGPSVSKTMGAHTLGLTGWYHRYKEKIPSITTIQSQANLYYYQMTGLEAVTGTIGGYSGFGREYVDHEFGAEVQYGYKSEGFSSVSAMSLARGSEDIWEQYERQPAHFYEYLYRIQSHNRIHRSSLIHHIDLDARYRQAYADEYRPLLVVTTDSVHGYNSYRYDNQFTYRKRYQLKALDLDLGYRIDFVEGGAVKNYTGLGARLTDIRQKHLLPTSTFDLRTIDLRAYYAHALLSNRRLWLRADVDYHIADKALMNLGNTSTVYATEVLLRDMDYYAANCLTVGLSAKYEFPLHIKGYHNLAYIKAYGQTHQAQRSMSATTAGFSLGIFY